MQNAAKAAAGLGLVLAIAGLLIYMVTRPVQYIPAQLPPAAAESPTRKPEVQQPTPRDLDDLRRLDHVIQEQERFQSK